MAGGRERFMVVFPVAGLAILVTLYLGGPRNALDSLERLAYNGWDRLVLILRH